MPAQNMPAFLFPKVLPASCVPHTDLVCALPISHAIQTEAFNTIYTCASLPALNLDHIDLSSYPVGTSHALHLLRLWGVACPPPNPGRRDFSCLLWFQRCVPQLYCLAWHIKKNIGKNQRAITYWGTYSYSLSKITPHHPSCCDK